MSPQEKYKELKTFFTEILPDHIGLMEDNMANQFIRKMCQEIILANPVGKVYGVEPPMSQIEYWIEVEKLAK